MCAPSVWIGSEDYPYIKPLVSYDRGITVKKLNRKIIPFQLQPFLPFQLPAFLPS